MNFFIGYGSFQGKSSLGEAFFMLMLILIVVYLYREIFTTKSTGKHTCTENLDFSLQSC